MSTAEFPAFFGPYRVIRALAPSSLAHRWLALHVRRQTSHVVHRFGVCGDRVERRRFTTAFEQLATVDHPHLLRVEHFSFGSKGRPLVVTPYTGSHDGLLTLRQLLDQKRGRLSEFEAERLIEHLLDASGYGLEHGLSHGAMQADDILIDRSGCLFVEHYGLRRALAGDTPATTVDADEIDSIVRLGYECLTGVTTATPLVKPSRLARLSDRAWDAFFGSCLGVAGVQTPAEVLEKLPSQAKVTNEEAEPLGAVRVALRKLRRTPTGEKPETSLES